MNNLFVQELYIASLLSKLSMFKPQEFYTNIETDDSLKDLESMVLNNMIHYIDEKDVKCFLFKYHNIIYIVVNSDTGSHKSNKQLQVKKKMQIHSCIYDQFNQIFWKVIEKLEDLIDIKATKNIYICGYREGGNVAKVLSAFLADKYKHTFLISCFTFASKMVGNKYFEKFLNHNVNRSYNIHTYNSVGNNCNRFFHKISNEFIINDNCICDIVPPEYFVFKRLFSKFYKNEQKPDPIDSYIEHLRNIIFKFNTNSQSSVAEDIL